MWNRGDQGVGSVRGEMCVCVLGEDECEGGHQALVSVYRSLFLSVASLSFAYCLWLPNVLSSFFYRAEGGSGDAPAATSCSVGVAMWRSCGSCRRGSRTCWRSSMPGWPTTTAGTGRAATGGLMLLREGVLMKTPRAGRRCCWPADESSCRGHYIRVAMKCSYRRVGYRCEYG